MLKDEKGETALVTIPNVFQSNGVIHVIDTVVMPNWVPNGTFRPNMEAKRMPPAKAAFCFSWNSELAHAPARAALARGTVRGASSARRKYDR
jgi:hypothetical protein